MPEPTPTRCPICGSVIDPETFYCAPDHMRSVSACEAMARALMTVRSCSQKIQFTAYYARHMKGRLWILANRLSTEPENVEETQ